MSNLGVHTLALGSFNLPLAVYLWIILVLIAILVKKPITEYYDSIDDFYNLSYGYPAVVTAIGWLNHKVGEVLLLIAVMIFTVLYVSKIVQKLFVGQSRFILPVTMGVAFTTDYWVGLFLSFEYKLYLYLVVFMILVGYLVFRNWFYKRYAQ